MTNQGLSITFWRINWDFYQGFIAFKGRKSVRSRLFVQALELVRKVKSRTRRAQIDDKSRAFDHVLEDKLGLLSGIHSFQGSKKREIQTFRTSSRACTKSQKPYPQSSNR